MDCRFCRLPVRFCCFQLNEIGIIVGWLGTIYRILTLVIFAVLLSMTETYHPNLFSLIFVIVITISSVNIVANGMLLYGIYSKKSLFMLPYLSTEVFEILILVIILVFFSVLYSFLNPFMLSWLIPLAVLILSKLRALYTYLYLCMIKLYLMYREPFPPLNENNDINVVYTVRDNFE